MESYKLYNVLPLLLKFLDELTNWYVKLNRKRIKGETDTSDCKVAIDVLYDTLLNMTILMAPFTPFLTEALYQNLANALHDGNERKQISIHYVRIPQYNQDMINLDIEEAVKRMQKIIEIGRKLRDNKKISLKTPVQEIKIIHRDPHYYESLKPILQFIHEELNTLDIKFELENPEIVQLSALPNNQVLGERLQKAFGPVRGAIGKLTNEQILDYERTKTITIQGHLLGEGDMFVKRKYKLEDVNLVSGGDDDMILIMDCLMTPELLLIGCTRELINNIQQLRKSSGLNVEDEIVMYYEPAGEYYSKILKEQFHALSHTLKIPILPVAEKAEGLKQINKGTIDHEGEVFTYHLYWKDINHE